VLGEVLLDELLQRQRAADTVLPTETFERPSERFRPRHYRRRNSPLHRLEPGPPVRYRYAQIGLPSTARFLSSKT